MKKTFFTNRLFIVATCLLLPSLAQAHPGEHSSTGMDHGWLHRLGSEYHLTEMATPYIMIPLGFGLVVAISLLATRKSRKEKAANAPKAKKVLS